MVRLQLSRFVASKLTWGKMVLVMLALLGGLQIIHMTMLTQLEARQSKTQSGKIFSLKQETDALFSDMKQEIESREVIDSSGDYRIVHYLFGTRLKKSAPKAVVTLVSQCSINHLHHIVKIRERWKGPISVSVFTLTDSIDQTVGALVNLLCCVPELRKNLTLHLVLPFNTSAKAKLTLSKSLPEQQYSCGATLVDSLKQRTESMYSNYALGVPYPNNLLRNIAWKNSHSDFILVIDIDMVPNGNLFEDFTQFAHNQIHPVIDESGLPQLPNTLYVIPAFEVDSHVAAVSFSRYTLLKLWDEGLVRPFYRQMCWKCQRYTDYPRWKKLSPGTSLQIGYEAQWNDPWEPFFFGPANMPLYDERFRQYGFNRISQVCELYIAGYKFAVLNNAFLTHQGFKTETTFHSTKEEEMTMNRALFRHFKENLKKIYPNTKRRCYRKDKP